MTRVIMISFYLIFVVMLSTSSQVYSASIASPNQSLSYALHLFEIRDYFRSISEFKKIKYYTNIDSIREYCNYKIGEAYYKSGKYQRSTLYFKKYIENNHDPTISYKAHMYIGGSLLQSNKYQLSSHHFRIVENSGLHPQAVYLWSGYVDTHILGIKEGIKIFRDIEGDGSADNRDHANRIAGILKSHDTRRLNPKIASIWSALIPGTGQLYSSHYYDAVQSLVLVGGFTYMTYASYRLGDLDKQSHFITGVSSLVTGIFYYANILGAGQTAKYRNQRDLHQTLNNIKVIIENQSGFSLKLGYTKDF